MPPVDDLLALTLDAFARFTQADVAPEARAHVGIARCLAERFPVIAFDELARVELASWEFGDPPDDEDTCVRARRTYRRPLRLRLYGVTLEDAPDGRFVRDVTEDQVTLCELPWMTPRGTFVVKGVERVVQAQLARCPGVWFDAVHGDDGRSRLRARVEPYRGPRLEVERTRANVFRARFGAGRWFPATVLARALGMTRADILQRAYVVDRLHLDVPLRITPAPGTLAGRRAGADLVLGAELVTKRHYRIVRRAATRWEAAGSPPLPLPDWPDLSRALADDLVDPTTGEVIAEAGEALTQRVLTRARACGVREAPVLCADLLDTWGRHDTRATRWTLDTELTSGCFDPAEAALTVVRALGDAHSLADEAPRALAHRLRDTARYDLSPRGRARMNRLLGTVGDSPFLTADDVVATLVALTARNQSVGDPDDDVPGAVVRTVGELLAERFEQGLDFALRAARERLSLRAPDAPIALHGMIDGAPIQRVVGEFLSRSRVAWPAAQHNPVARVAQLRWLAAVEPNQVSQRRTGFDLDDTAPSQLGLLCPVEPPVTRGASLALGATVDANGALTPRAPAFDAEHRPVLADDLAWLGATAALVPFAVHDAVEAWMGGCRALLEALPPVRARPPAVRTTLDARVARDSRMPEGRGVAEGTLACGADLLVALMPWYGYTDARAVVVSERVVRDHLLSVARGGALVPLAVGDVLGSRHGDRGAVSCVAPDEDLPHLVDGTPVDMILHPATVLDPGAVGMLCEMAADAPCVVDACARGERDVRREVLRDGRTGEAFPSPVTVGVLHVLRLPPLACDVFEARARGERDVSTRQPSAGQELAEDAVWALVAHGAAWTLRESLTARGDDARAAREVDRALARGESAAPEAASGTFEAFLRAAQAMGLAVSAPKRR